jgi:hypothetical protein
MDGDPPPRDRRAGRRRPARGPAAALALVLALGAGATACGESGGSAKTGSVGATAAAAARPSGTSPVVPGAADLRSALLTAHDIGMTPAPDSGGSTGLSGTGVTGCAPLAGLLSRPPGTGTAGQSEQDAAFTAGGAGPFVGEGLTAESPARLAADYAKAAKALTACRSVTFTGGATKLTFDLTPIKFGGADSSGARMDTTYDGVQVNGYLAMQRIGPAIMTFYFFQVGGGSSQLASAYYRQAVQKADRVLGAQAG